jgi:hypothetical protein
VNDRQTRVVSTREQAHAAAQQAYAIAKLLIQDGRRAMISVGEDSDPISIKQRRFLHGPVFTQISEQVRVGGERYVMPIWKEFFRKLFLPDRYEMQRRPVWNKETRQWQAAKRATPQRVRSSTEDLSVKQYSAYIDKVIQHATLEWNVVFDFDQQERESVRYVKPVRAPKEIVDQETGEIYA